MDKNEYIKQRDSPEMSLTLFYEYGKEKEMTVNEKDFYEQFPKYMFSGMVTIIDGTPKAFNYALCIEKIIKHYNLKFNLQ